MTPAPNPQPVAGLTGVLLPVSASAAPTPAVTGPTAGGFSISEARERELLRAVPRLRCAGEIEGFRWWLGVTGEKPTVAVEAALVRQAERVR